MNIRTLALLSEERGLDCNLCSTIVEPCLYYGTWLYSAMYFVFWCNSQKMADFGLDDVRTPTMYF